MRWVAGLGKRVAWWWLGCLYELRTHIDWGRSDHYGLWPVGDHQVQGPVAGLLPTYRVCIQAILVPVQLMGKIRMDSVRTGLTMVSQLMEMKPRTKQQLNHENNRQGCIEPAA